MPPIALRLPYSAHQSCLLRKWLWLQRREWFVRLLRPLHRPFFERLGDPERVYAVVPAVSWIHLANSFSYFEKCPDLARLDYAFCYSGH